MKTKPVFLISNDDGYRSPGLRALWRLAKHLGSAYVVAPDREQSASSHALTLHRPLRIEPEGEHIWAVDGTPTDCINIGIHGSMLDIGPSMILSGINLGANLGDEVTYSGTVAAAMEGCLLGKQAIAFSSVAYDLEGQEWDSLLPWAEKIIEKIIAQPLPKYSFLNVNFPDPRRGPILGIRVTRQGRRVYGADVIEKTDPRNRKYYWIGGNVLDDEHVVGSDIEAIDHRYVSVTPIHVDLTDYPLLHKIEGWFSS